LALLGRFPSVALVGRFPTVALLGQKTDDARRLAGIVEIADRKPAPRQRTLAGNNGEMSNSLKSCIRGECRMTSSASRALAKRVRS
jgi:hypothetical protein